MMMSSPFVARLIKAISFFLASVTVISMFRTSRELRVSLVADATSHGSFYLQELTRRLCPALILPMFLISISLLVFRCHFVELRFHLLGKLRQFLRNNVAHGLH